MVKACNDVGLTKAVYIMEPDEDAEHIEEIHYISELIPYKDYIEILNKSNCVLELERKNDYHASSLRVLEAVILNKKILTDNDNIFNMPCCSGKDKYIQNFNHVWEIDIEFLKHRGEVDFGYKGEYSAELFLKKITDYLN